MNYEKSRMQRKKNEKKKEKVYEVIYKVGGLANALLAIIKLIFFFAR